MSISSTIQVTLIWLLLIPDDCEIDTIDVVTGWSEESALYALIRPDVRSFPGVKEGYHSLRESET
jgi:hypothetical protein